MTDIVERLENWEKVYPEEQQDEEEGTLYVKAAAEIRRLRSEISDLEIEMDNWNHELNERSVGD